ncbi:MAG: hypothetical protein ACREFP_09105 [Acetobacteraceae bacterium]
MFLWIESQPTAVIALILFGFCYAPAAIIFATVAMWKGSMPRHA